VRIDQRCSGQGCKDSHSFPASQTAGVDVKRTSRSGTADGSIGRKAHLQESPRESPEFGAIPVIPSLARDSLLKVKSVHAKFSAAIAMDLSPPRAPPARPIEKPDDNHRKPKLESFTSAF
jgi:hypothetical protein